MSFKSFEFHSKITMGIQHAGFTAPTPIQAAAIPQGLNGKDLLGIAETGTGKTAAFVLPTLQKLICGPRRKVRALIIAPTRELADQIHENISLLGRKTGLKSMTVYGGVGMQPQIDKLWRGVDLVVACPGRLLDHAARGTIDLSNVETLVLDEADRMFDMGFLPDVRKIVRKLPSQRQTMLFSATMPKEIRHLAGEVLTDPKSIKVARKPMADTVSHSLYPVEKNRKTALLVEILKRTETESVLVFTSTKHLAKRIAEKLEKSGHKATSLQGNLSQGRRQAALNGFRDGTFSVLVATDIAARGIDVSTVSHVINYDMPRTVEDYTHRTGRTGRACRSGDAFSLITGEDRKLVRQIEQVLKAKIDRRTVDGYTSEVAKVEKGVKRLSLAKPGLCRAKNRRRSFSRGKKESPHA